MINCHYLTALLTIFGILYIAFIVSAYKLMNNYNNGDIIRDRDRPLTNFGTKSETDR